MLELDPGLARKVCKMDTTHPQKLVQCSTRSPHTRFQSIHTTIIILSAFPHLFKSTFFFGENSLKNYEKSLSFSLCDSYFGFCDFCSRNVPRITPFSHNMIYFTSLYEPNTAILNATLHIPLLSTSLFIYPSVSSSSQIRMLENRLDKSMIKYNEAQAIRKTYEQIVKRLKEERIGFDNQLAAIERTLKAKDHDYHELLSMSHDANHANAMSKAELGQFRAAYEEERRQKDIELSERKQAVQKRIDHTQRLERKEKLSKAKDAEAAAPKQEEERPKQAAVEPAPEEQEKLTQYEDAFAKIKEATGVADVHEVIHKFITQEDTHRNLVDMKEATQAKIDNLNIEKANLKAKLEELKYSGSGQLGSRRIVDEFETHLAEARHQCEKNCLKYERAAKLLINVKAGIEHLRYSLLPFFFCTLCDVFTEREKSVHLFTPFLVQ